MSAEKGKIYAFWLDFFRTAGILPSYDSKYALVFEDNRIKPDMLLDLTKECLRDMEITAMGDIIAILRHAKVAHEQSKTLAFGKTDPPANVNASSPATIATASSTSIPSSSAIQKSITQTKSSEKVTTTTPALASTITKDPVKPKPVTSQVVTKASFTRTEPDKREAEAVRPVSGVLNKDTDKQPPKAQKRFIIVDQESSSDSDAPEKRTRESPVQKKRTLASVEGSSGSGLLNNRLGPTVTTDKPKGVNSKGVFARLDRNEDSLVSGAATIFRSGTSTPPAKASSGESSSVFERLGGRGNTGGRSEPIETSSGHRSDEYDRRRDTGRRDDKPEARRNDYERNDRRITIQRRSSPERRISERSGSSLRDRSPRTDDRNSNIRSEVSYNKPSQGKYSRPETDVKSRLGGSTSARADDSKGRRKIVATSTIKNVSDLRVGQVLKTTRIQRSDGKSVVQRVIVKKVPKTPARFRDYRSPQDESDEADDY